MVKKLIKRVIENNKKEGISTRKEISLDYEDYNRELSKKYEEGFYEGMGSVVALFIECWKKNTLQEFFEVEKHFIEKVLQGDEIEKFKVFLEDVNHEERCF